MNNRISDHKTPSAAEREARKVFREKDAEKSVSEYDRAQQAFHANRERLKAERLAREAVSTERDAGRRSGKLRKASREP